MDDIEAELEALEHVFSDASAEPSKLSYGLLRSITNNFSYEIGRGGFGVVYLGCLGNGDVAVKKLYNPHTLPDKQFLDEITCLKKAKHKNIVRFLGYCSEIHGELFEINGAHVMAEVHKKLLCFEHVPNGNIQGYLQQEKPHGEDWLLRYQMIRGICQGLHCLHDNHINHLDMKPENVMLDDHMEAKIVDFGLSRFIDQGQSKIVTQHILGTPRYIAPEIIDKGELSFKSDVYALGIIIIELLTGINKMSLENWDESLDLDCPRVRRCTEIARRCTDLDKYKRPTIHEIIRDLEEHELENDTCILRHDFILHHELRRIALEDRWSTARREIRLKFHDKRWIEPEQSPVLRIKVPVSHGAPIPKVLQIGNSPSNSPEGYGNAPPGGYFIGRPAA